MNTYFPIGEQAIEHKGIDCLQYILKDEAQTTILRSVLKPNATVEEHSHDEYQICIATKGSLTVKCEDEVFVLEVNKHALYIPKGIPHSARNESNEEVHSIDIKRMFVPKHEKLQKATLLNLTPTQTIKSGIEICFFVGPWFEIMYSALPHKGLMPKHKHKNEQIGIGLSGSYNVQIEDEISEFTAKTVYYAPANTYHSGWNNNDEFAYSFNMFIPKKYNKKVYIS